VKEIMADNHNNKTLYRVRFQGKEENKISEITVRYVTSSDIMGCIVLEQIVFQEQSKHLIVPEQAELQKRYQNVNKLHIPYHSLIAIEELACEKEKKQTLSVIRQNIKSEVHEKT